MRTMNKAEQRALKHLWDRGFCSNTLRNYLAFRRTAYYSHMGCWLVDWCGMMIGIESDGYTHS